MALKTPAILSEVVGRADVEARIVESEEVGVVEAGETPELVDANGAVVGAVLTDVVD